MGYFFYGFTRIEPLAKSVNNGIVIVYDTSNILQPDLDGVINQLISGGPHPLGHSTTIVLETILKCSDIVPTCLPKSVTNIQGFS